MQIDSSSPAASLIQGVKEGGKAQPPETVNNQNQQASVTTGQSDMVTLTDAAAHMQRIEQAITAQPVVNSQRVEQLQQAVNDGGLKRDPAHLASRMLNFENALNNARSGA